ncbi:raffinose synthase Sip1 [Diplogelasinospora grovesii]|uniref:Raffinose synthase Sip1 n=1 Tax=Diplogelasinospora grovesii TaxID=303347 RepID=A0AAN6S8Y5_9PEZI|nr:raffinose synthase Sip1 [Diplogelasinospora grovesii]
MSTESNPEPVFQVAFIPVQKQITTVKPDELKAFISTYPPLGQVTQVKKGDVTFQAVLDVEKHMSQEAWEVALWHSNGDGQEWIEVPLELGKDQRPSSLQFDDNNLERLHFSVTLRGQSSMHFTLKFRPSPQNDWMWVRDHQDTGDGVVIVDKGSIQEKTSGDDLPDLIQNLNPDLKWKSQMSQSPGTRLWSIETSVDGAKDDQSGYADVPLGVPWGQFIRWFALVRLWAPWLAPRHGKSTFGLDKDAVLCSFLSPQGKHLVFLGISGFSDVMTLLRSGGSGELVLHLRNDSTETGAGTVLVAVGDDFERANAAVMYHARTLVMASNKATGEHDAEIAALQDGVRPEWYENWYDGLGFCTWNALGQKLTDEKVLKAVDTLAENNISITSLIIDDNWQSIDYRGDGQWQYGWNDFEAEPKAFPKGLKALVSEIRGRHKNIQHIAVWHALLGYWAGIAPDGPIAKRYKTVQVPCEADEHRSQPIGGKMTVVAKEDAQQFYDDFYRFLVDCGIDGVKTDGQFMLDTWTSASARRELIHTYLDAWTLASLRHFSIKAISCMSQAPQILFYSQLPRNRPAVLVRNSDDFFPEVPASHPWHVWTNAHNTLLTQHLNILPDWDMFQTAMPEYSGFHAAARCVSGGPIYITDVPGQHNLDLIKQMTGVTPRGKTVIFRPSVLGRTIDPYTGYEDDCLLKVGAYHGRAATGTPILGVFNVSTRGLTEVVPLERFPGVVNSQHYIVRSHVSGIATPPLQLGTPASLLTVHLDTKGYDILCAFPLSVFTVEKLGGDIYLGNVGLIGKMTGCAAILNSSMTMQENGQLRIETTLKALGTLGIYCSALPKISILDDLMVTIQGQPLPPKAVSVNDKDGHVLEVDIEKAWNEMGLESGWANEVTVKIYFHMQKYT